MLFVCKTQVSRFVNLHVLKFHIFNALPEYVSPRNYTINILANQTSGTAALQTFTLSAGDYLTVDVLSIGNSTKGAGLVVQFKYKRV